VFRFVPGSLSAIYVVWPFVFNNFSGSFLKKGILFYFISLICPKNYRSQALEEDYHTRPVFVKQNPREDFPHFLPRVAAEPQLERQFERRTRLALYHLV
jgi:hypothetical protein